MNLAATADDESISFLLMRSKKECMAYREKFRDLCMNVACSRREREIEEGKKKKSFQVSSYRVRNELAVSATLFSSAKKESTYTRRYFRCICVSIQAHDKNT